MRQPGALRAEAQPTLGGREGPPSRTKATPPPDPAGPRRGHRATRTTSHLQVQGPWPSSLGRQGGASEGPLAQGRIKPHPCSPLISLLIGISENGFHNSVSSNQLFRTHFPQTQTATVSKIISDSAQSLPRLPAASKHSLSLPQRPQSPANTTHPDPGHMMGGVRLSLPRAWEGVRPGHSCSQPA